MEHALNNVAAIRKIIAFILPLRLFLLPFGFSARWVHISSVRYRDSSDFRRFAPFRLLAHGNCGKQPKVSPQSKLVPVRFRQTERNTATLSILVAPRSLTRCLSALRVTPIAACRRSLTFLFLNREAYHQVQVLFCSAQSVGGALEKNFTGA